MIYKTEWTHRPVDLTEEQRTTLNREIEHISAELDSASDLIFHTVFLTEDMDGAIIIVDGKDGVKDTLFLTYYEMPKWVTLEDLKDGTD
jgi:hypothetical protein